MSDIAARHFCKLGWATLAVVVLFGFFVWPTQYEYHTLRTVFYLRSNNARPREMLYRIHRLTGTAEKIAESAEKDGTQAP
jgi:hypothetical protein